MTLPTREQIDTWGQNYVRYWNDGDKAAWVRNWRAMAPGEFRMLDPVGTPEKLGFANCCENSFDLFQPNIRFHVPAETRFICGNEICWVMENHFSTDGEVKVLRSIESFRFEADGSVVIRTWYDVPEPEDTEIGRIFDTYLPGRA
ncbi:MAG: hypothetical protein CALGDGBN_00868 [Pseudomonadales bacterium]|nr:hypothetical protein [Pseudomonadales bacterium]